MQVNLETLREAVRRGVITESEAVSVWLHLQAQRRPASGLRVDASAPGPLRLVRPGRPALVSAAVALGSALAQLVHRHRA